MWIYNIIHHTWTNIEQQSTTYNIPYMRAWTEFVLLPNKQQIIMFGGLATSWKMKSEFDHEYVSMCMCMYVRVRMERFATENGAAVIVYCHSL